MLMKTAQWLIATLFPDMQDKDQQLLCAYGCELWLYTVFSTLGLLMIGWLLDASLESAIMIVIFYLCQSNGGGFHASSHLRCFLTMAVGLLLGLLSIRIPTIRLILPYVCIVSFLILLVIPLRLHPNKSYLETHRRLLCVRSYLVTLTLAISIFFIGFWEAASLFYASCFAVFLSAVSRICAAGR